VLLVGGSSTRHVQATASSSIGTERSRCLQSAQLGDPPEALGYSEKLGTPETYLDARDTDADMCGLYHADVICAIPNGEENGLEVFLHQLDDKSFL